MLRFQGRWVFLQANYINSTINNNNKYIIINKYFFFFFLFLQRTGLKKQGL